MKLLVHGATGRMGGAMLRCIAEKLPEAEAIPVAIDAVDGYRHLSEYPGQADCVVDFSNHTATFELIDYCRKRKTPVVIATTGQTEQELACIRQASKEIPVFLSANMSLGVAILIRLARQTAKVFPDADIEIVETHHNQKLDAPSGTALAIARGIQEVRPKATLHCGRNGYGKRTEEEIGIHALRMGSAVGIHEVHICTGSQTITLRHEAHDRSLFADGALEAAKFLIGKPAGFYEIQNLLQEEE